MFARGTETKAPNQLLDIDNTASVQIAFFLSVTAEWG